MKNAKKTSTPKPPTCAEVSRSLEQLRRKVALLRRSLAGEAAELELMNECGVNGSDSPKDRANKAGALRRCTIGLDYVLQGEV